jgi:hypothetical protein
MKLLLFIITFILATSTIFGQTYVIEKGNLQIVSTRGTLVGMPNSSTNAQVLNPDQVIMLDEGWGINTINVSSFGYLVFADKIHTLIDGKTTLWVDNVEKFVDRDESGNLLPDSGGVIANFRLHGGATFKLAKLTEEGYFSVATNSADLEVKSTWFSVATLGGTTTVVECYEGEIMFTNSKTLGTTILAAGQSATIFGKEGYMNLVVDVRALDEYQIRAAKEKADLLSVGTETK